jgi:hypothetical protein
MCNLAGGEGGEGRRRMKEGREGMNFCKRGLSEGIKGDYQEEEGGDKGEGTRGEKYRCMQYMCVCVYYIYMKKAQ